MKRPAHRPRKDPKVLRVPIRAWVHPRTKDAITEEAQDLGLSQGEVLDLKFNEKQGEDK